MQGESLNGNAMAVERKWRSLNQANQIPAAVFTGFLLARQQIGKTSRTSFVTGIRLGVWKNEPFHILMILTRPSTISRRICDGIA
jgi:hypothetical protein